MEHQRCSHTLAKGLQLLRQRELPPYPSRSNLPQAQSSFDERTNERTKLDREVENETPKERRNQEHEYEGRRKEKLEGGWKGMRCMLVGKTRDGERRDGKKKLDPPLPRA